MGETPARNKKHKSKQSKRAPKQQTRRAGHEIKTQTNGATANEPQIVSTLICDKKSREGCSGLRDWRLEFWEFDAKKLAIFFDR
jgi:hypothetical protein